MKAEIFLALAKNYKNSEKISSKFLITRYLSNDKNVQLQKVQFKKISKFKTYCYLKSKNN